MAVAAAALGACAAVDARVDPVVPRLESQFAVVAALVPSYESQVEIVGPAGRIRRVVSGPSRSRAWAANWSPDGSRLAWADGRGLTVERGDGFERRLLVATSTSCSHVCLPLTFAWSPDGQRLLIGGAGRHGTHLLVVSPTTGRRADLVPARPDVEYRVIGWARDGQEIAYTRASGDPGTASCCQLELVIDRPDGRRPRVLFRFADGGIHDTPLASFSPDGRFIAFTTESRDPRDPRLAIVDVRRDRVRVIHGLNPGLAVPRWSPDSRRLAVATSGNVLLLATTGSRIGSLGVAGDPLVWRRGVGLLLVAGRQSQEVLRSPDGRQRPRLLFRLPKRQSLLALDAR